MSGYLGLREDARIGAALAEKIAALFPPRHLSGIRIRRVGFSPRGACGKTRC